MRNLIYIALALIAHTGLSLFAGETLENECMQIHFAGADEGFAVTAIVNKVAGNVRFVTRETKPLRGPLSDLWKLEMSGSNEIGKITHYFISNRTPARNKKATRKESSLCFAFEGVQLRDGELDVYADVSLPKGAAESEWRIRVVNRSKTWGVYYTIYPTLHGVARNGEADFLQPGSRLGWRLRKKYDGTGVKAAASYSCGSSPLAAAFMIGEAGLLFAPHNGRGEITKTFWEGEQNICCYTPPENAGKPMCSSSPGFPVSIGVFKGDWIAAAKLYRTWATNQAWCAKGKKAHRKDGMKKFYEIALWHRIWSDAEGAEKDLKMIRARLPNLNVGIHWYGWHNSIFDFNYPEYFPAKKRVPKVMERAEKSGYLVMPYMNARLWDMNSVSYRAFAHKGVCRKEDGSPYVELYGYDRHQQATMCPAVPFWRDAIFDFVSRAITEVGANMVYLDMMGISKAQPCFAAGHPHPAGGGTWWHDGYTEVISALRAKHPGIPFTTEGCCERWLHIVDGFLVAVPLPDDVKPFYTAVYSDYATYFGTPLNRNADISDFRAYQAQNYVWGVQPGWMKAAHYLEKDRTEYYEWMRKLAKARSQAKDYLCYGELIGELEVSAPTEKISVSWPKYENPSKAEVYKTEMPPVVGAWWRTADGKRIALVAVNHTTERQTVKFRLLSGEDKTLVFEPLSVAVYEPR